MVYLFLDPTVYFVQEKGSEHNQVVLAPNKSLFMILYIVKIIKYLFLAINYIT